MEAITGELVSWFLQHGPMGGIALLMTGFYMYERNGRGKDREASDARIKELQDEHLETLKIVLPLVQKFTSTMDTVLPMVVANASRRSE
ncbi:MAG TPA: hypothetical protein DEB63_04890 [Agrobacterium sp.]|nr:hypothetical protein [Agrobacterium sp.]